MTSSPPSAKCYVTCKIPGCEEKAPAPAYFCMGCWELLDSKFQSRLCNLFQPDGTHEATPEWRKASNDAINSILKKRGKKPLPPLSKQTNPPEFVHSRLLVLLKTYVQALETMRPGENPVGLTLRLGEKFALAQKEIEVLRTMTVATITRVLSEQLDLIKR